MDVLLLAGKSRLKVGRKPLREQSLSAPIEKLSPKLRMKVERKKYVI